MRRSVSNPRHSNLHLGWKQTFRIGKRRFWTWQATGIYWYAALTCRVRGGRVCEITGCFKASVTDWLNHLFLTVHTSLVNNRGKYKVMAAQRVNDTLMLASRYLAAVWTPAGGCRFCGSSAAGRPFCQLTRSPGRTAMSTWFCRKNQTDIYVSIAGKLYMFIHPMKCYTLKQCIEFRLDLVGMASNWSWWPVKTVNGSMWG